MLISPNAASTIIPTAMSPKPANTVACVLPKADGIPPSV